MAVLARCGCRGSSGTGNVGNMIGSGRSSIMLVLLIRVGVEGWRPGMNKTIIITPIPLEDWPIYALRGF